MATSPLPSRGPTRGRKCYVTPPFSGVPIKADRIKSGYLTLAFLGAHMRAEVLHNPCVLEGPHQRGQNQKWLPHLCLLGGPHEGGSYVIPAFSEVPIKRDKNGPGRVVSCKMPSGVVLKGGPKIEKNFGSLGTALIRSGPKVAHWLQKSISSTQGQLFSNWSGSVRWTKQTLYPKKGGGSVV